MKILAVSVSKPVEIQYNGKLIRTGIFKKPVASRLKATVAGLEGDGQADLEAHGGADKAIYLYSSDNYLFWQQELGVDEFPWGQFGENLTVEGLLDESVHIGDRYRMGDVLVEVTQPRIPCFKLGIRMGSSRFPKRFLQSGRVGFYVRVLQPAELGVGDLIEKVSEDRHKLSVRRSLVALSGGPEQLDVIKQALRIEALSDAWRKDLSERLQKSSPV
jgi:MOSC domain-containing protein YiiM